MKQLRLSAEEAHAPCGSISYCHRVRGCASSAYELKEKNATVFLTVPRNAAICSARLAFFDESVSQKLFESEGEWYDIDGENDIYSFSFNLDALGVGLFFFRAELINFSGGIFSHKSGESVIFNKDEKTYGMFQLTICDFTYAEPEKLYGGIIYHIFVDRFMRGGRVNIPSYFNFVDGEWKSIPEYPEYPGAPLKNNTIYGGTLKGVEDKLDYIASLGVTTIYLSPIFLSVSNHKYDTADYMQVDPSLGGDSALKSLIKKAKNVGIDIILDGVFNHTGADSIYFNKYGRFDSLGAYQSPNSEYFDWYDFKSHPDRYTCWWDIDILPRINPDISSCRNFLSGENGVVSKYRKMGIYGLRLDVADELSDAFLETIKARLSEDGESILYGEVWEDASNKIAYDVRKRYYLGTELDGVMNYPLRTGIIEYIKYKKTDALRYALSEVSLNAPDRVMHAQMNLLGTHDTERILTLFGDEDSQGKSNSYLCHKRMTDEQITTASARLKAAYTVLATLPGVPTIFYGDEAGLEGYHDPFNRMPYPWGHENQELIEHYKAIGSVRSENSVYKKGSFNLHMLTPDILVFSRNNNGYSYFTVFNNSSNTITVTFNADSCSVIYGSEDLCAGVAAIYKVKSAKEIYISQRQIV